VTAYAVLLRTTDGLQMVAQAETGAGVVWSSAHDTAQCMAWDDAVSLAHRARSASVCAGDIVEVILAPGGDACRAH
jgi:hypothetical protein